MLLVFVTLWILFAIWAVTRKRAVANNHSAASYWRALDENRNPWK